MKSVQDNERNRINGLRSELAKSLKHRYPVIGTLDVNPDSLKHGDLFLTSLENLENRHYLESWHNSVEDGIRALHIIRADIFFPRLLAQHGI
mmetsp:Transcript_1740/g.2220  ORF Transcript_1740/g.2220 Transcript_1740/m.2220 type:complete len:92 (+) Transcript_1740:75-350(+)